MSVFSFIDSAGKKFKITGPEGLNLEQAKSIFDKQSSSGSLVGLKPGSVLSAATQAAKGLQSAISSLGQQASGIVGALGGGISSAVGKIGSLIPGGSGGTGNGLSLGGIVDKVSGAASSAFSSAKSIASKAVTSVSDALKTPSTNGISVANFAKQATALAPVSGMNVADTTGVLAQTKKLVGQAADKLTDNKGVGSYGFDLSQLEKSGYVKPGTSKLVNAGLSAGSAAASKISSVLKSPSVFTGKDGVTDIKKMLSNVSLQDKTQQGLMAQGAAGLKSLGVPMDSLSAKGAAGLVMSAAKSLPDAASFVKQLPLPPGVSASITKNITEGAFAVGMVATKIDSAFKAETKPTPATGTTNRETLNAAANRITGNDKIPTPSYTSSSASLSDLDKEFTRRGTELSEKLDLVFAEIQALGNQAIALDEQSTISQADYDKLLAAKEAYKNGQAVEINKLYSEFIAWYSEQPASFQRDNAPTFNAFQERAKSIVAIKAEIYKLIEKLAAKVA